VAASTAVSWDDTPRRAPIAARSAQFASLTGLRGFAALMVVTIHVAGVTQYPWLGMPDYGPVSLFVLSGYLLYRPWAKWSLKAGERPLVGTFARRRIGRIFPAYLAVLLVLVAVYPPSRPDGLDRWLQALSLTGIYFPGGLMPELFQTWSLGTELSWYVALPVMAVASAVIARRFSPGRGIWVVVALMSLSLPISAAWRWWVASEDLGKYFTYGFWLPGYLVCFAGGGLVALLVEAHRADLIPLRRLRAIAEDRWTLIVFAATVTLVGTSTLGGPDGILRPTTFAEHQTRFIAATLLALVLLVAAVLGRPDSPLNLLLSTRWFNAIGRWSYGIYLWHMPIIVILVDFFDFPGGFWGAVLWFVIVLAASVPLSAATYRWVEVPAISWSRGRGLLGRREPVPPPQTSSETDLPLAEVRPDTRVSSTNSQPRTPTATPTRSERPGE
jgi:peptidoglycan/LPS O-acetylase OafA/YrhL